MPRSKSRPTSQIANPVQNHILAALPRAEYQRIAPSLQPDELSAGRVLYEPGESMSHVYFVNAGMVSLVSRADDRSFLEVGMIGNEGIVGVSTMLGMNRMPQRAIVQLDGHALKMQVSAVKKECKKGGKLESLLLRSMYLLHFQVTRSAVCNRFHSIEARLCRWLLMCRDRANSNVLSLTQEFLSQMLGAARPMVSFVASGLQKDGLIRYNRGQVTILDSKRLESKACECYRIVTEEFERFV